MLFPSLLTDKERALIRAELADGRNPSVLAAQYGVSFRAIASCGPYVKTQMLPRELKFTDATIVEIRQKRADGALLQELSVEYRTAPSRISMICTGRVRADAGGPFTRGRVSK